MTNTHLTKLNALFVENERPTITGVNVQENSAYIDMFIPESLSWFKGHFPEQAVLPGVVQIDWAGKIGKALLLDSGMFQQLSNIKFKSMVLPNTELKVEIKYDPSKKSLKFHFFNDGESFSVGTFKYSS